MNTGKVNKVGCYILDYSYAYASNKIYKKEARVWKWERWTKLGGRDAYASKKEYVKKGARVWIRERWTKWGIGIYAAGLRSIPLIHISIYGIYKYKQTNLHLWNLDYLICLFEVDFWITCNKIKPREDREVNTEHSSIQSSQRFNVSSL